MTEDLDRWLSPEIRRALEQKYYGEVNHRAQFEVLRYDPTFLEALQKQQPHIALFADHGVVHVRDVARQILAIMDRVHGRLIPQRPPWRKASMMGYGVLLAYFHDIGMYDFSAFGRAMHPEFACQSVFDPQLDDTIEAIWRENMANLSWRLLQLNQVGIIDQNPRVVHRELLALAMAHSKSKVPTDTLIDRSRLRQAMTDAVSTNLNQMFGMQHIAKAKTKLDEAYRQSDASAIEHWSMTLEKAEYTFSANRGEDAINPHLWHFYRSPDEPFAWLTSDQPEVRELADDAIDTVRVLRCADSLRQRGHLLKTSGGYEIFVSRQTANTIISFQSAEGKLYLLEIKDPISAGEANIASSEIDADCNLRISFYRGDFDTAEASEFAVRAAAQVIEDIQKDAIDSFQRSADDDTVPGLKRADDMQILLEEIDDLAGFVTRIRHRIEAINPALEGRIHLAPSLRDTSDHERAIYLTAAPATWDLPTRRNFLQRFQQAGHRIEGIDPDTAFRNTRLVDLRSGDVLFEAGAPAAFVYIPMGAGLRIFPLGGYDAVPAQPWNPIGSTGVIRGASRNATITAEKSLSLLMIPKGVYMRQWHRTHTPDSFLRAMEEVED